MKTKARRIFVLQNLLLTRNPQTDTEREFWTPKIRDESYLPSEKNREKKNAAPLLAGAQIM
jgi:hypothetical protein